MPKRKIKTNLSLDNALESKNDLKESDIINFFKYDFYDQQESSESYRLLPNENKTENKLNILFKDKESQQKYEDFINSNLSFIKKDENDKNNDKENRIACSVFVYKKDDDKKSMNFEIIKEDYDDFSKSKIFQRSYYKAINSLDDKLLKEQKKELELRNSSMQDISNLKETNLRNIQERNQFNFITKEIVKDPSNLLEDIKSKINSNYNKLIQNNDVFKNDDFINKINNSKNNEDIKNHLASFNKEMGNIAIENKKLYEKQASTPEYKEFIKECNKNKKKQKILLFLKDNPEKLKELVMERRGHSEEFLLTQIENENIFKEYQDNIKKDKLDSVYITILSTSDTCNECSNTISSIRDKVEEYFMEYSLSENPNIKLLYSSTKPYLNVHNKPNIEYNDMLSPVSDNNKNIFQESNAKIIQTKPFDSAFVNSAKKESEKKLFNSNNLRLEDMLKGVDVSGITSICKETKSYYSPSSTPLLDNNNNNNNINR